VFVFLSTILGSVLSVIHFDAEIKMKIVMSTCSKNHVPTCASMARSPVLPGSPRWARCAGMARGLEIVGTRAGSECRRQSKTGTSASPMRGVVHGPSGSGGDPGWEESARIGDAAGEVQPRQFVACQKQRQEGVGTLFAEPDLKTAKSEGPTASELGAEPPEPPSRTATKRSPAIGVWRCRAHILTAADSAQNDDHERRHHGPICRSGGCGGDLSVGFHRPKAELDIGEEWSWRNSLVARE